MTPERNERILHKEVTVGVSVEQGWRAWTPSEGMGAWWVKQSWIELRVGGAFELYFAPDPPRGLQGSEACRILSYRPLEMLSFSWNFPPSLPDIRSELTWVVMRFVATGPAETHVVLDQLGWKQGPAWGAGWKYFDDAWGRVLELFRKKFPLLRPSAT